MPSTYLFGISAVMFGIGLAGGMKYAWKGKARAGTVGKAAKVLFAATALCMGSFGLVTVAVARYMGVNSIQEFSSRMRVVVPETSASLRDAAPITNNLHSTATSHSTSTPPSSTTSPPASTTTSAPSSPTPRANDA